jgi:predicted HNH restriction endonuclease
MNISMDLSEVLLYLELMKKFRRKPSLPEMNLMLYFLKNYEEVKEFYSKFTELGLKMPKNYEADVLIHFIEELEDTYRLKEVIIAKRDRRIKSYYSSLFIQQIFLSKTKEQAISIWEESKKYGEDLAEVWINRFNSKWRIREKIENWRKERHAFDFEYLPKMIEEYGQLKDKFFTELTLSNLKLKIQENEVIDRDSCKEGKTFVYTRNVLIKEFARRVAKGICQLCESDAPFLDNQGNPFLEVHHIKYLSKGGSDTIENVVALCPNCHRKVHLLELEEDFTKIKEKALSNMNV